MPTVGALALAAPLAAQDPKAPADVAGEEKAPGVTPRSDALAPVKNGAVRVEWTGADADGDPLFYTVLYSGNGGESWMDVAFETNETSVLVPIDPDGPVDAHRVLVCATDGGRSADAILILQPDSGGS